MGAMGTYGVMMVVFIVSYGVFKLFGTWWEKGWEIKKDSE